MVKETIIKTYFVDNIAPDDFPGTNSYKGI